MSTYSVSLFHFFWRWRWLARSANERVQSCCAICKRPNPNYSTLLYSTLLSLPKKKKKKKNPSSRLPDKEREHTLLKNLVYSTYVPYRGVTYIQMMMMMMMMMRRFSYSRPPFPPFPPYLSHPVSRLLGRRYEVGPSSLALTVPVRCHPLPLSPFPEGNQNRHAWICSSP